MKQNKTVILINGLPRSGKDTSADMIIDNYSAVKMSFASPLKSIIANTFGITLEELEDYKNNTEDYGLEIKAYPNNQPDCTIKHITFRDILRLFGTEGMKPEFGSNVWSDLLYNKVHESDSDIIVVPDYRFMTEYKPQKGINIIRLLIKDTRELPTEGHASDVELYQNNVEFDYVIHNVGSLEELEKNIKEVMTDILQ